MNIDYNLYAQEYDIMCAHNPEYQRLLLQLKEDLEHIEGDKVAEFGSGTGNVILQSILPSFASVTSIDNNKAFLSKQKAKLQQLGLESRVDLIEASVTHENFEPQSLDCAVMVHCLNLLPESQRIQSLDHIYHALKQGGTFVIADINQPINVDFWLDEVILPHIYETQGDKGVELFNTQTQNAQAINREVAKIQYQGQIWTPSLEELTRTLENVGFTIESSKDTLYAETDNYIIAKKY